MFIIILNHHVIVLIGFEKLFNLGVLLIVEASDDGEKLSNHEELVDSNLLGEGTTQGNKKGSPVHVASVFDFLVQLFKARGNKLTLSFTIQRSRARRCTS